MAAADFGDKMNELHRIKYNLFKEQNPEKGRFDVIFEAEGKILYAHKTMLNLVSDTFDAMLSERWTKNDEPTKIKVHSYDNFYQFLTFLYSAKCELTNTNIFAMVDIAEFYGVQIFKAYCDQYLTKMEITTENIFSLIDLVNKYSMFQLKHYVHIFITENFQKIVDSGGFLNLDKSVAEKFVIFAKNKVKPEDLFQAVYKWCEKQVMEKQTSDPNLNLNDAIKAEITDFLPHIYFRRMNLHFLLDFVVSRAFVFSSFKELSKILCERSGYSETRVKITNGAGEILHGNLIPNERVIQDIVALNLTECKGAFTRGCYWYTESDKPNTSSPLKKKDGIKWYLIYEHNKQISAFESSAIKESHYLLAELIPGSTGFFKAYGSKIEIE